MIFPYHTNNVGDEKEDVLARGIVRSIRDAVGRPVTVGSDFRLGIRGRVLGLDGLSSGLWAHGVNEVSFYCMLKVKLRVVVIIKVVWLIMQRRSLDRDNGQNLRKGQGLLGAVEAIEEAKENL